MRKQLKISKPKYYFANGQPYRGPVFTDQINRKFTGIMPTKGAKQVFTLQELRIGEGSLRDRSGPGQPVKTYNNTINQAPNTPPPASGGD